MRPEFTDDVDQVAAAFQRYFAMGYTDIIIRNLVTDQSKALASTSRLRAVKARLTELGSTPATGRK